MTVKNGLILIFTIPDLNESKKFCEDQIRKNNE